ncbi:MAG: flippase-like domain-containing protein [Prevotellaceae bacterium]|jgi:hypothetical protein|nr:flippase-like domain-containing protein [Prevotellaceae bacterium]
MKKRFQIFLNLLFAVAAYGFLAYKLLSFEHYDILFDTLRLFEVRQFAWLFAVVLLLVPNLVLEAYKWQLLVRKTEKKSLKEALKSITAGIYTGFFTPNRIGDMAGRLLYFAPENRRQGIVLSIVSGLTTNLTVLVAGIPALAIFLLITSKTLINNKIIYFSAAGCLTVLLLIFYFLIPKTGKKISESSKFPKIKLFFSHLQNFGTADLFAIFCVSMARYFVFCIQFYCMLRFFGVDISIIHSLAGICSNYLLITFTPSFSFSEAAVRGSYAVIVFGSFGVDEVLCAVTGISIWLINTMIPVIFGSFFVLKKKMKRIL